MDRVTLPTEDDIYWFRLASADGVRRLYKFRSFSGEARRWVSETIEQHKIYFSRPAQLNDPFDMQPVFRVAGEPNDPEVRDRIIRDSRRLMKESKKRIPLDRQIRELQALRVKDLAVMAREVTHHIRTHLEQRFGVYSLSASGTHPLLWAHYADHHRGVCLHFDSETGNSPFALARRVLYQEQRPSIPIPLEAQERDLIVDWSGLTKAAWWSYEMEYRLFLSDGDPPNWIQLIAGQIGQFEARFLTGLTLGIRTSEVDRKELTALARAHAPPLEIHQVIESDDAFAVRVERLE